MQLRTPRRGGRLVAAVATVALLGAPLISAPADAAAAKPKAPTVKVMTRNLYLGADIMRPIKAIGSVDPNDPACPSPTICYQGKVLNAFAHANWETWDIVNQTDFPTRAKLLAAELVANKPDLVGLQEAALWRTGTFDDPVANSQEFATPNADHVEFDFLQNLLDEVNAQGAAEGVAYKALSVNTLSDVEGPTFQGSYGSQEQKDTAKDVRLTMRDVILKRTDSNIRYIKDSEQHRKYKTNMPVITVAGKSIKFKRGYQWVDMKAGDKKFRFINTHLEAFSSDVALGEAKELIKGPGSYDGTTITVCDCNSDPLNGDVKTDIGDTKPHWAPYRFITGKGGFFDEWLQWATAEEGFTSGLSETIKDSTDANDDGIEDSFDHRIDMVFGHSANGKPLAAKSGAITGNELTDRDPTTGLWPSDHAGVVMKLRLR